MAKNNKRDNFEYRKTSDILTIVLQIVVCRDHVYVSHIVLRKCLQGVILHRLKTALLRTNVQG